MNRLATTAPLLLAGSVLGMLSVWYVDSINSGLLRLVALPLVLALLGLLLIDKRRLFLLIMLGRSICDPLFDAAKFSVGSLSLGIGAALNALVILVAALFISERGALQTRVKAVAAGPAAVPVWLAATSLLLLAAVLRSPEPATAVRTLLVLLSYAAVFVIPFHLKQDDMHACIRIVLLSSVLPVVYALFDIAMHMGPGFRLQSSFTHPNIFAFYLLLVIALLFHGLKSKLTQWSSLQRWLSGLYMALLLCLLILTQTRSAWLAGFFIFAAYALCCERRLLLPLIITPLLALAVPEVRERLLDLSERNQFDSYAQLNSFDWRLAIWKAGIAWMQPLNILIGYGLNAFTHYSPQFFVLAGNTHPGAHNVYVQCFFETGLLGLLCMVWLAFLLLRTLWRRWPVDKRGATILIALVLAYLIVGASDNLIDYLSFNWYFWFALGAVCSDTLSQTGGRNHARS